MKAKSLYIYSCFFIAFFLLVLTILRNAATRYVQDQKSAFLCDTLRTLPESSVTQRLHQIASAVTGQEEIGSLAFPRRMSMLTNMSSSYYVKAPLMIRITHSNGAIHDIEIVKAEFK